MGLLCVVHHELREGLSLRRSEKELILGPGKRALQQWVGAIYALLPGVLRLKARNTAPRRCKHAERGSILAARETLHGPEVTDEVAPPAPLCREQQMIPRYGAPRVAQREEALPGARAGRRESFG